MTPALVLLLPLGLGALLIAWPRPSPAVRRRLAMAGALGLFAAALWLLWHALTEQPVAMVAGGWPAPYGILLVADGLAALLLALAAVLALAALAHAAATNTDRPGRSFHALFQLQLFGIAGTLLAGDLLNLFVFFEVLLLASYGLLLLGSAQQGRPCPPAVALHYVLLNLMGSSLFLVALALLYAAAGTLNMSQLAAQLGSLERPDQALAGSGLLLLATVLALKAALLPLLAWLPGTYAAAPAPAAAVFTLLTKVGVYGLLRLWTLANADIAAALPGVPEPMLGPMLGPTDEAIAAHGPHPVSALLGPVLLAAAVATTAVGAIGVLAAQGLRLLIAWLLPVSVGTMLAGIAAGGTPGLAAALYYLVQSTLITAGLFLLADLLPPGRRPAPVLGVLFLLGAAGIAGMPPLSGFVGKVLILSAVAPGAEVPSSAAWLLIWPTVFGASLLLVLALTQTGIRRFWSPVGSTAPVPKLPALLPAAVLIGAGPLLVACAGPASGLAAAVAAQTLDGRGYAAAIAVLAPAAAGAPSQGDPAAEAAP